MNRTVAELFGTVFNIGKLPLAPGTWSSFIAVLVWYIFFDELNPDYEIKFIEGIITLSFFFKFMDRNDK